MTIERLLPRLDADKLRHLAYRLEGEETHTMPVTCSDCKSTLPLKICQSAAGYYLGYFCNNCGPYDRVSGYYQKHEEAEAALTQLTPSGDTDGDTIDAGYLERQQFLASYQNCVTDKEMEARQYVAPTGWDGDIIDEQRNYLTTFYMLGAMTP